MSRHPWKDWLRIAIWILLWLLFAFALACIMAWFGWLST